MSVIGNNGCYFEPRLFVHICKFKSSDNPTIVRPHADKNGAGAIVVTPAVCYTTARNEKPSWCGGSTAVRGGISVSFCADATLLSAQLTSTGVRAS